jgi:hypothetical protein
VLFGVVYVASSGNALVWRGALDFSRMDEDVLKDLPADISEDLTPDRELFISARASFILSSGDLVKCEVHQSEEYSQYRRVMEHPDQILFARYDVLDNYLNPPSSYSFTAENQLLLDDPSSAKLSVKLPNHLLWSPSLIRWVIDHHLDSKILDDGINPDKIAETISSLSISEWA